MFRESLPDQCPPSDAIEVDEQWIGYRYVKTNPPTSDDFDSHCVMHPGRQYHDMCAFSSVSLEHDLARARIIAKSAKFKAGHLCRVILGPGAGVLKQDGRPTHYNWWPYASFDILANSVVI